MADPDLLRLPSDLPVPEDDGAADGLEGREVPAVRLRATKGGSVDLAEAAQGWLVVYVYPRTGGPDVELPDDWDRIPGARGCTAESCAFRDQLRELTEAGASAVCGLSAQPFAEQRSFAAREALPYPLVNDSNLILARKLDLPTFKGGDIRLYRRLTFIANRGRIDKVFYPVFPPDRHPAEVTDWLRSRRLDERP